MSLTLNVGICKRIAQPDLGSLGALCSVEVALDPSLIFDAVAGFPIRAKQAFTACHQAVDEELTRGHAMPGKADCQR